MVQMTPINKYQNPASPFTSRRFGMDLLMQEKANNGGDTSTKSFIGLPFNPCIMEESGLGLNEEKLNRQI